MHRKMMGTLVAATAGMLLITSCSSTAIEGDAVLSSGGDKVDAAAIDLDTGDFRTTPQPPFSTVGSPEQGIYVEGQRMAEYVVLPTELDPQLTSASPMSTLVLKNADALGNVLGEEAIEIAEREGMVMGYSTARSYEDKDSLNGLAHAVMRFPDAEAAKRAAQGFAERDTQPLEYQAAAENTPIAILPDTFVTSRTTPGSDYRDEEFSAQGWTPHNEYVIYTWASTDPGNKDWAAQMIAKGLELQGPLIDQFPATPVADFGSLKMDIDSLLIYTIPPVDGKRTTSDLAVYGPRGTAHRSSNPALAMDYFEQTGTTLMATDATNVYRSKDAAGAKKLGELFIEELTTREGFTPADTPPNVPNATCLSRFMSSGEATYCVVQNGSYLGEISGFDDEAGVHQMAAAQYLILDSAK